MEYRTPILVAFTLFIITLCYFYYKKTKAIKDKQMEETLRFADFKDENKHFTSEKFDACSDKDLVNLIVALIGDLEDEDENFLDKLNMEERTVYGISQLNECVSTTKTIRSFFETLAYSVYADELETYFNNVREPQIAELVKSARRLNEIMENGEEDEDMGDYSSYNFSDFTHEYITMIAGTDFMPKLTKYIREHKESFIEGDETNEERVTN